VKFFKYWCYSPAVASTLHESKNDDNDDDCNDHNGNNTNDSDDDARDHDTDDNNHNRFSQILLDITKGKTGFESRTTISPT